MNFFTRTVGFAALSASVVSAENTLRVSERRLDDSIIDGLCSACDVCDALGDLCSLNDIVDLACANCGSFGVDGLCDACNTCDSAGDLCDPDAVSDLGCGLCDGDLPIDTPTGDTCFSETATVQVLGADGSKTTTMKDLTLGDRILTKDGSYQTVYAFGHHHPAQSAKFFQIHSENNERPLEVTLGHLIFLEGKSSPVPAETIRVGDVLSGLNSGSTVTKVGSVERKGIYAPLTTGGTLIVDGVVASSYIHFTEKQEFLSDHDMIHVSLSPYRILCTGVSATFCDTHSHLDNGMPHYAYYGLELLKCLLKSNAVVRTVGLSIILIFIGGCQILESTFGASLAPLLVFLGATAYASQAKSKKSKTKGL